MHAHTNTQNPTNGLMFVLGTFIGILWYMQPMTEYIWQAMCAIAMQEITVISSYGP